MLYIITYTYTKHFNCLFLYLYKVGIKLGLVLLLYTIVG